MVEDIELNQIEKELEELINKEPAEVDVFNEFERKIADIEALLGEKEHTESTKLAPEVEQLIRALVISQNLVKVLIQKSENTVKEDVWKKVGSRIKRLENQMAQFEDFIKKTKAL